MCRALGFHRGNAHSPVSLRTRVLGPMGPGAITLTPVHTMRFSVLSLHVQPDREPCHSNRSSPRGCCCLFIWVANSLKAETTFRPGLNHPISQPQPALWVQRGRRRVSTAEWAAPTPKGARVPTTSPPLQGSDPQGTCNLHQPPPPVSL